MEREGCKRCGRAMAAIGDGEPGVCAGCLTATEDMEETGAVVRLLHTAMTRRPPDRKAIDALERAMLAVLDNLNGRLVVPDAVGVALERADVPIVTRRRSEDDLAAPPA